MKESSLRVGDRPCTHENIPFSARKPSWPRTVFLRRVFSKQPLLLDFDFGERAGGLGGSEDSFKIHCTFANTAFQPSWTKGLLDSQPSVRALACLL